MVSDKELFIQSIEEYVCGVAKKLFGISSLPGQTLIKYGIRNLSDKYEFLIDVLIDKHGKLNQELLVDALKSEIRCRGGIRFMGIKFNESDVEEIMDIYNKLMSGNV